MPGMKLKHEENGEMPDVMETVEDGEVRENSNTAVTSQQIELLAAK